MNYEIGNNIEDLSEYLKETDCIDFSNPLVAQKADGLKAASSDTRTIIKTLIVYTSQTGFTRKYAQWLAESTEADIFDQRNVQKKGNSFF